MLSFDPSLSGGARDAGDDGGVMTTADGGVDAGPADGGADAGDGGPDAMVDSDDDGVPDARDPSPNNPSACGDSDADSCDDCGSGAFDPDADGPDRDRDGACDACDVAVCSAQGTCTIVDGVVACACRDGWGGDDCRVDLDECTLGDNPCRDGGDAEATCNNTRGSYLCSCSSDEFVVRQGTCRPPDACLDDENRCDDGDDPDAICTTVGDDGRDFECRCSGPGFVVVSGVCVDVDECLEADNPCDDGGDRDAACTDEIGGYTCTCSGSDFKPVDGTCLVDEGCSPEADPCAEAGDPGGICTGSDSDGHVCACSPGVGGVRCEAFHASCQAIKAAGLASGDGMYLIDPFGDAPFEVFCDMTTDGGGWTAVTAELAQAGFRSTMTALADGVCDLNGENPRARSMIETVVCRYDMDLGFRFNRIRLVDGQVTTRAISPDPNELSHNDGDWGTADCVSGDEGLGATGDVRLGAASDPQGALSLGSATGIAACAAPAQYNADEALSWSGDTTVAAGSVLRLELSESGGIEAEGWEWTGGTIFVREEVPLTGQGVVGDPRTWADGAAPTGCEGYRRPLDAGREAGLEDGIYAVDVDGEGPGQAFEAHCRMEPAAGGWTLLGVVSGADADNWATQYGYWSDDAVLGSLEDLDVDYKSPAWSGLDLTGGEIMLERRHDGRARASTILGSACLQGEGRLGDLFVEPTDTDVACGRSDIRVVTASPAGVASEAFAEGNAYGLGGADTNGFCWNGGDSRDDGFDGHLLWSERSHRETCLAPDHLGGVSVYAARGEGHAQADIAGTAWLDGVDAAQVVIRVYGRDVPFAAGAGTREWPHRPRVGTGRARASCAAYRDHAGGSAHSGFYVLDPDGPGGAPLETAYCDMDTAGGGWRRAFVWERVDDPELHTLASLRAAVVDEVMPLIEGGADVSLMGELVEEVDHIAWSDMDASSGALSYRLELSGTGNEVRLVLHYEGDSLESSGIWLYAAGDTAVGDLACFDDTASTDAFSADELSLVPYTCGTSGPASFVWDRPRIVDLGEPARAVYLRSLHDDSNGGGQSRLYRFAVYTR